LKSEPFTQSFKRNDSGIKFLARDNSAGDIITNIKQSKYKNVNQTHQEDIRPYKPKKYHNVQSKDTPEVFAVHS
jgi:hypothetical protein